MKQKEINESQAYTYNPSQSLSQFEITLHNLSNEENDVKIFSIFVESETSKRKTKGKIEQKKNGEKKRLGLFWCVTTAGTNVLHSL